MIIRITVNDNDFGGILEEFFNYIKKFRFTDTLKNDGSDMFLKRYFEVSQNDKKFCKILNKTSGEMVLSTKDEIFLVESLRNVFKEYVKDNPSKDYLLANLDIRIEKSFVEQDENLEVIYFFSKTRISIWQ